jgi:hypothetical protein
VTVVGRPIADYEAPTVNVTVPAAIAKQYGNTSIAVSSQSDAAEVVLADRTAVMDLTFSAAPLQPAVAGAYLMQQGHLQSCGLQCDWTT